MVAIFGSFKAKFSGITAKNSRIAPGWAFST